MQLTKSSKSISILHLNIRSLKKHLEDLEALVYCLESPPGIICLSETWLNEEDDPCNFLVKGYNNFANKDRN